MQFIGNYWWIWLIGALLCFGAAAYNQLQRMRRMTDYPSNDEFLKGLELLVLAVLCGLAFGLLLVIGAIVNFSNYLRAG